MIAIALCLLQESRDVALADAPVEIRVPVVGEGRQRATVVTFPEDSLEALVAGWKEGDLSVERRRENLFLKLLRRAEGDLHVLGGSGRLYRLSVRPAEEAYDGQVRILAPKAQSRPIPEPVELVRAMRLGRLPEDGHVRKAQGVLYRSDTIEVRGVYVYETSSYRGYVARVENISSDSHRLDPSRFAAPELVLAGARQMVLRPGETTHLYLVLWRKP